MAIYLKLFGTHSQYESYTADTETFIKPNVSYCKNVPSEVHYNPLRCEETSVYEIVGTPTYPSTIDGDVTSFDITVNYKRTDINLYCQETITEGTDTVTVECGQNPSTSTTRTVSGTVDYYGNEIEYSIEQSKFELKVTAKFNVTDISNPTRIASGTSSFTKIEIDGVIVSTRTGYTFSTTGEHTVKYHLNGTNIGRDAFSRCSAMTTCTIGDGVTAISGTAFYSATTLTSVDIPDSVTTIGNNAFKSCYRLEKLNSDTYGVFNIPSGVTSIGYGVFSGTQVGKITIPSGVTKISNEMFVNCVGLESIGYIGSGASVEIPTNINEIGGLAFSQCYSLTSVTIPNSVTTIGGGAFENCENIESIVIPNSVTSIGSNVFYACTGFTSIDIPNSVTSIGSGAFEGCYNLYSVYIYPSDPPELGSSAFDNTNDCSIYVPDVNTYSSADGWSDYEDRLQWM